MEERVNREHFLGKEVWGVFVTFSDSSICLFCRTTGVAGFVVNAKKQVLVIQEKYHPHTKDAPWKFPGGMADKCMHLNPLPIKCFNPLPYNP